MSFAAPYETELLAPAGCWPSLQSAIDAGADSVYFGLAQLNMRARARRSFELGDLAEITRRCREGGVKSCLTLNTLLYQHDLTVAAKIMDEAKRCRVDAVIVSDMAAVQMANDRDIEVHLSTQLSLSNVDAIKFYAPYCDRVVLARELNLRMIKSIHRQILSEPILGRAGKPMEIEAFAHGALCIAVSGRCGMSLFTENASANRGACGQNCRRAYEVTDKDTGKKLVVDNDFIMSPNDIATIDFMDQLLDSGVKVLKLEGRGRPPEYVYTVTTAYRRAIDAVNDGTYSQEFVQELYEDLKSVFNRGMSSGYYLGREQGWSGVHGSKATHRKAYVGDVTNYYAKIGVAEIEARASGLATGETYVVIGETTGTLKGTAGELRLDVDAVDAAPKGSTFSLKVERKVRRGDKLYKMVPIHAPHQPQKS